MFEKKQIEAAVEKALAEGKGKRKFVQSVDLAINFKDLDFKKAENRLNVDVVLPRAPKPVKITVFADGQLALDARKADAEFIVAGAEIPSYATNKTKQKELLDCATLASPQLMAVVGKSLGQILAVKGRLPKPILPNSNLTELFDKTRRTVTLKSKGKFLPCVHCIIGTETMPAPQIAENITEVLEALEKKVADSQIKSVFVKTTMGKPVKIG